MCVCVYIINIFQKSTQSKLLSNARDANTRATICRCNFLFLFFSTTRPGPVRVRKKARAEGVEPSRRSLDLTGVQRRNDNNIISTARTSYAFCVLRSYNDSNNNNCFFFSINKTYLVKPLNSGNARSWKFRLFFGGVRYSKGVYFLNS